MEKEMQVSFEKPPVWEEANKLFKLDGRTGVVFTYGDTIYNPWKVNIPQDLIEHEKTHAKQQNWSTDEAKIWWEKYIADPEFRIQQEVEAYGRQYRFLCKTNKDRNKRARILWELAEMCSGPLYGNAVSFNEAMNRIRKSSGVV